MRGAHRSHNDIQNHMKMKMKPRYAKTVAKMQATNIAANEECARYTHPPFKWIIQTFAAYK